MYTLTKEKLITHIKKLVIGNLISNISYIARYTYLNKNLATNRLRFSFKNNELLLRLITQFLRMREMRKEKYYLLRPEKRSKWTIYMFGGIIIFIVIYFPFFAVNLRYQVGATFSKIFDTFGTACLTIGSAMTAISILSLFISKSMNTRWFILGIALLWIGCWCTGSVLNIFGITIGNETSNPGYH